MASLAQKKKAGNWYAILKVPGRLNPLWKNTQTKSQEVAKQILRKWENEIAKGNAGIFEIEPIKFGAFCPKYLEWASAHKGPHTMQLEKSLIENHLKPFFSEWSLERIQPRDIDRYIAERRAEKDSPARFRSLNLELTLLSFMLKKALEWKNLLRLPFAKIPKLKETDSKQRRALNQIEVSRLLTAASGQTRLFIALLAYTGARREEVMFLRWADIDLERAQITIRPKPEVGFTTKSGKTRVIPLHSDIRATLESFPNTEGWLFSDARGKRIGHFRKSFKTACRKAGLEGISPHCLRHSFASLLVQNGVDVKTLSEILGHASPVITLQVYAHSFDSYRRQAISKLPSFETGAGELVRFPPEKVAIQGKET